MSPRRSYRLLPEVEAWIARQGYALERETAAALKLSGFKSTSGRHYLDVTTGKLREIDLVAQAVLSSRVLMAAVIECKQSSAGAWIVRESKFEREHRMWQPVGQAGSPI